jgi:hypothetical protein
VTVLRFGMMTTPWRTFISTLTRWMASAASQTAWLPPRGTHNITIGSSIRRSLSKDPSAQQPPSQPLRNDFVAMRCEPFIPLFSAHRMFCLISIYFPNSPDNLKPPGVANAAGSLVPSGSYANKESYQLELNAEVNTRPIQWLP